MKIALTRSTINHLLYLIAKDYKKQNKANPDCEVILVGGASILLNYDFRTETTDIDSIIRASSTFKEIANKIGDEYHLPNGWINTDFIQTKSYSSKLIEHSKFYKKFYGCLSVRTVSAEYLVAMKLKSLRVYKHDLSDVIGIIKEQEEFQNPISFKAIDSAYRELYNESMSKEAVDFLTEVFASNSLSDLFYETIDEESENKRALIQAEEKYANDITEDNVDSFLKHFR